MLYEALRDLLLPITEDYFHEWLEILINAWVGMIGIKIDLSGGRFQTLYTKTSCIHDLKSLKSFQKSEKEIDFGFSSHKWQLYNFSFTMSGHPMNVSQEICDLWLYLKIVPYFKAWMYSSLKTMTAKEFLMRMCHKNLPQTSV